jgi:CheY-like chemotaxis protein
MLAHPLQSRRIVLVEDDEVLRRHLANILRRSFSDLDVRGATDADDALHLLEDERSRLLITDAQNRSLDGLAVATSARKLRPTLPVIVMSNHGYEATPGSVPPLAAASWLEKPPKTERLVGLVKHMLSVPIGFSGSLSIQGLPDLVQLLCMANVSGALYVERGPERGVIFFERGNVVDAALDEEHGAPVVARMLRWQGGVFALDRETRPERTTITVPPMQLLLEAVQEIDQENATEPPPVSKKRSSSSELRLKPVAGQARTRARKETVEHAVLDGNADDEKAALQRAAESFQRGMELALHKHYDEALREWERATELDPANRTYQVNLRRLHEVRRRKSSMGETHGDQE